MCGVLDMVSTWSGLSKEGTVGCVDGCYCIVVKTHAVILLQMRAEPVAISTPLLCCKGAGRDLCTTAEASGVMQERACGCCMAAAGCLSENGAAGGL